MTRLLRASTLVAGLVTVATLAVSGGEPAGVAAAGLAGLLVGTRRERRGVVDLGGAVVLLAVVLAGSRGHPVNLLVLGTVGALVAWDSASHAVGLGTQLDDEAVTQRGEAVHLGVTLVATAALATLAMLTFVAGGQVPLVAGLLLAAGAVLVASGLSPDTAE
jgi:hypothetical protein